MDTDTDAGAKRVAPPPPDDAVPSAKRAHAQPPDLPPRAPPSPAGGGEAAEGEVDDEGAAALLGGLEGLEGPAWNTLPDVVLRRIREFVGRKSLTQVAMHQVCRGWHHALGRPIRPGVWPSRSIVFGVRPRYMAWALQCRWLDPTGALTLSCRLPREVGHHFMRALKAELDDVPTASHLFFKQYYGEGGSIEHRLMAHLPAGLDVDIEELRPRDGRHLQGLDAAVHARHHLAIQNAVERLEHRADNPGRADAPPPAGPPRAERNPVRRALAMPAAAPRAAPVAAMRDPMEAFGPADDPVSRRCYLLVLQRIRHFSENGGRRPLDEATRMLADVTERIARARVARMPVRVAEVAAGELATAMALVLMARRGNAQNVPLRGGVLRASNHLLVLGRQYLIALVGRAIWPAAPPAAAAPAEERARPGAGPIGTRTWNPLRGRLDEALHAACEPGNLEAVKFLRHELGMTTEQARSRNNFAIRTSAFRGHHDLFAFLVDPEGFGLTLDDMRCSNNYPLRVACDNGCVPIVRLLLERGITLEDVRANRNEAICAACVKGHTGVVRLLLDTHRVGLTHEDLCARENYALRSAVWQGHVDIVRLLVEAGGLTRDDVADGNFAVILAIRFRRVAMVRYLVEELEVPVPEGLAEAARALLDGVEGGGAV